MLSIVQAAEQGIERIRKPIWAIPFDHLKIDIVDGKPGVWTHLFSPFNIECNGQDPMNLTIFSLDYESEEWETYNGALPNSDEYKDAQEEYKGSLSNEHA